MSKENLPEDWDQLWIKYTRSLKTWRETFESLQRAASDVQSKYNEIMIKALKDSSGKIMSQFIENLQRSMIDVGMNAFKQFGDTGNSANTKIIIKTPGQSINDLITMGNRFGANTFILKDASRILNNLNPKNDETACGKLSMFINQVNQSHKLTPSQKAQLIKDTNAIKTNIGCK